MPWLGRPAFALMAPDKEAAAAERSGEHLSFHQSFLVFQDCQKSKRPNARSVVLDKALERQNLAFSMV